MTPFFNTPERQEALLAGARKWEGTPFAPASAVCGPRGGACCHRACAAVWIEGGLPITQDELPDAPLNRANNHLGSMIGDWLAANPERFQAVSPGWESLQPGDLIIVVNGIGGHHVAVVLPGGLMVQSFQKIGVHITRVDHEARATRLRKGLVYAVYRPLDTEVTS